MSPTGLGLLPPAHLARPLDKTPDGTGRAPVGQAGPFILRLAEALDINPAELVDPTAAMTADAFQRHAERAGLASTVGTRQPALRSMLTVC